MRSERTNNAVVRTGEGAALVTSSARISTGRVVMQTTIPWVMNTQVRMYAPSQLVGSCSSSCSASAAIRYDDQFQSLAPSATLHSAQL